MVRKLLVKKLEGLIGNQRMTVRISNILTENLVQIDDGIGKLGWISQEIGLLQGDPLSPTLFNAFTADVEERIKGGAKARILR